MAMKRMIQGRRRERVPTETIPVTYERSSSRGLEKSPGGKEEGKRKEALFSEPQRG